MAPAIPVNCQQAVHQHVTNEKIPVESKDTGMLDFFMFLQYDLGQLKYS